MSSTSVNESLSESTDYQKAVLRGLQSDPRDPSRVKHVYGGTVSFAERARRRRKGKAQRAARRKNRSA